MRPKLGDACLSCGKPLTIDTLTYRQVDETMWVWPLKPKAGGKMQLKASLSWWTGRDTLAFWLEHVCGHEYEGYSNDGVVGFGYPWDDDGPDPLDPIVCRTCGDPKGMAGDGWNGECGTCADRRDGGNA